MLSINIKIEQIVEIIYGKGRIGRTIVMKNRLYRNRLSSRKKQIAQLDKATSLYTEGRRFESREGLLSFLSLRLFYLLFIWERIKL